jgi:hypothetical protein
MNSASSSSCEIHARHPNAGADNYMLIAGNFDRYHIIDRVGMTVELVPHLFATGNNRPSGQRGLRLLTDQFHLIDSGARTTLQAGGDGTRRADKVVARLREGRPDRRSSRRLRTPELRAGEPELVDEIAR